MLPDFQVFCPQAEGPPGPGRPGFRAGPRLTKSVFLRWIVCRSSSVTAPCRPSARFAAPRSAPPGEVEGGEWYDFAAGSCTCGAVFAHDPTARNGGAVFLQALLMAADGDMDRAMGLAEGVDYDVGYVQKYNVELHRLEPNSFGTLYFVRLRAGSRGLTGRGCGRQASPHSSRRENR